MTWPLVSKSRSIFYTLGGAFGPSARLFGDGMMSKCDHFSLGKPDEVVTRPDGTAGGRMNLSINFLSVK